MFKKNKLTVNVNKTCSMLIGTKQKVSQYCNLKTLGLNIDGKEISNRSSYAYLGLVIDCHLTWNEAVLI